MDLTFEDVAWVIQDARYAAAVGDLQPRPDKKIPNIGRNFNLPQFMEKYDINCRTVMAEPLGRFFLDMFADYDVKLRMRDQPKSVASLDLAMKPETQFLNFVGAVYDLRRQDPNDTAPFVQVLQLLKEHEVDKMERVQSFLGETDKETSKILESAVEEAYSLREEPAEDLNADGALDDGDIRVNVNDDDDDDDAPSPPLAVGSHDQEEEALDEETQVSRYDPGRGGAGTVGTTKGGRPGPTTMDRHSKAVMTRSPSYRTHTVRSKDLNKSLELMMEKVVQPIYDRFSENRGAFMQYVRFKNFVHLPVSDRQIRYHRILGQGAFGTVHGCIVAQTGTMLAMKTMLKKKIKLKHSKSQVVAERFALEALAIHPSPYCMRLRYAFQTKEAFHLILPLAIGGDLKFHLRQGPFDEKRAKFYAAEIAVGLGHIHSLGFIMRDLKPRNILLDSEGHCKISDFGLAASITDGRTVKGRAGTEGYWSPEVINNLPYGIDADWWSYGCCLFELLTGFNPFSCKHTGLQTRNEGTRKSRIKFTKQVPPSAKVLINQLLDRNVDNRLGCQGGGVDEIFDPTFAFWKGLDMVKIKRGTHPVPWVPEKGVIYAASQSEMLENDDDPNGATLRRVKLTPEDMPEFDDFVDIHDHMLDLIKVLPNYNDVSSIVDDVLNKKKPSSSRTLDRKRSKNPQSLKTAKGSSKGCADTKKCVIS